MHETLFTSGLLIGALACYIINRYNSSKRTKTLEFYKEKWKIKTDEKQP